MCWPLSTHSTTHIHTHTYTLTHSHSLSLSLESQPKTTPQPSHQLHKIHPGCPLDQEPLAHCQDCIIRQGDLGLEYQKLPLWDHHKGCRCSPRGYTLWIARA